MVAKRRVSILPPAEDLKFFSTGCTLLDCVLGGGWARGKVINVVGDKSSGKTLLAIEASANFVRCVPKGLVDYDEAEAAFDPAYARTLGLPEDRLLLVDSVHTAEALFQQIEVLLKSDEEHLLIVDSLDALTDEAEVKRDIGDASYGAAKAKIMSEGFRKLIREMNRSKLTLFVISQIRDKIGAVAFAKKVQRTGGHALDFYCSQVLWLYETGKIKKTVGGIERAIGMNIKARCEKNKVGMPWRECEIPVIYGFGMDDKTAALDWLATAQPLAMRRIRDDITKDNWKRHMPNLDRARIGQVVREVWDDVERKFAPETRKYPS